MKETSLISVDDVKNVVNKCVREIMCGVSGCTVTYDVDVDDQRRVHLDIQKEGWNKLKIDVAVYVYYKDCWELLVAWTQGVYAQPSARAIKTGRETQSMINYLTKDGWLANFIVSEVNQKNQARLAKLAQAHKQAYAGTYNINK